jgi:hypothetical protein
VVPSAHPVGPRPVRPALDWSVDEAGDARSPRHGIKAPGAPPGPNVSIACWTAMTWDVGPAGHSPTRSPPAEGDRAEDRCHHSDRDKDSSGRPIRGHGGGRDPVVESRRVEHPVVEADGPSGELHKEGLREHAVGGDWRSARPDAQQEYATADHSDCRGHHRPSPASRSQAVGVDFPVPTALRRCPGSADAR